MTDDKINKAEEQMATLCQRFATTLGGSITTQGRDLCVVTKYRSIEVKIAGRPSNSPLAIASTFSFESFDIDGNALCLGETVVLQEEINPFVKALKNLGIEVTAINNHWLFDNPRIMYVHWYSIVNPIIFAMQVASAMAILK